jgi:GNAT superfamily N-acetyltransferase
MSTEIALGNEHRRPRTPASAPPRERKRERRLEISPASYPDMKIAADIISSTASWYEPFLEPEDMAEHEVDGDWIEENYERRDFYLGWHGTRPVGVLSLQETGDYLYVGYVYLHENETGQGFGRELLEYAQEQAVRQNKKGLVLIAHPEAEWATRAYRRFGFEKVAERREEVLAWNGGWLEPYYEEGFQLYELRV